MTNNEPGPVAEDRQATGENVVIGFRIPATCECGSFASADLEYCRDCIGGDVFVRHPFSSVIKDADRSLRPVTRTAAPGATPTSIPLSRMPEATPRRDDAGGGTGTLSLRLARVRLAPQFQGGASSPHRSKPAITRRLNTSMRGAGVTRRSNW